MSSVRVIRDVSCPMRCQGGEVIVHVEPMTFVPKPCPLCHGIGTVPERVTCATCANWMRKDDKYGVCVSDWIGISTETAESFACAAWEARS